MLLRLLLLLCLLLTGETSLERIARVLLRSLDVTRRRLGHDTLRPMVGESRIARHDVPGCDAICWIWRSEGCVQGGAWTQVGWTLGWLTWGMSAENISNHRRRCYLPRFIVRGDGEKIEENG